MTTWAIVPVKSFGRAKSRLANLSPLARVELARALLARTLQAIERSECLAACLIATDCDDIATQMHGRGHHVQRDLSDEPLGAIVDRALVCAHQGGATRAVVLMSDLPLITSADIDELAAHLSAADAVVAPDRVDAGTNALGLRLPDVGATCFGHADSFSRHLRALSQRDATTTIVRNPRLAFDVDVPGDLDAATRDLLPRQYGEL